MCVIRMGSEACFGGARMAGMLAAGGQEAGNSRQEAGRAVQRKSTKTKDRHSGGQGWQPRDMPLACRRRMVTTGCITVRCGCSGASPESIRHHPLLTPQQSARRVGHCLQSRSCTSILIGPSDF